MKMVTMPKPKPKITCAHYYPGYPYDYVVLALGPTICGACYVNAVNADRR